MTSPLHNAIAWLAAVLTGPAATALAAVAVALLGLATLGGRFDRRQALRILLGLFLLFAAPRLASGLHALRADGDEQHSAGLTDQTGASPHAICWTCK